MNQNESDKCANKEIQEFSESEIKEVLKIINDNYKSFRNDDKVVVLFGKTQSGKSTLANRLRNVKMIKVVDDEGFYYLKLALENEGAKVGDGKNSCTKIPAYFESDQRCPLNILDTRGYKDVTFQRMEVIASSFLVDLYLRNFKRIIPVIVFNIYYFIHTLDFTANKDIVNDLVKNANSPFIFIANNWRPGPAHYGIYHTKDDEEYMRELDNILRKNFITSMNIKWSNIVNYLTKDEPSGSKLRSSLLSKFEFDNINQEDENEQKKGKEEILTDEEINNMVSRIEEKHRKANNKELLKELDDVVSEIKYLFIMKKAYEDNRIIFYDGLRQITVDRLKQVFLSAKSVSPSQVNVRDAMKESKNLMTDIMKRIDNMSEYVKAIKKGYKFPMHIDILIDRCDYYIKKLEEDNQEILRGSNNIIEELSDKQLEKRISSCNKNIEDINKAIERTKSLLEKVDTDEYKCYREKEFESENYRKENTCDVEVPICEKTIANYYLSRSTKLVKESFDFVNMKYTGKFTGEKEQSKIMKVLSFVLKFYTNRYRIDDEMREDPICNGIVFFSAPYNKTDEGKEVIERMTKKKEYLNRTMKRLNNNVKKYTEQQNHKQTIDLRKQQIEKINSFKEKLNEIKELVNRTYSFFQQKKDFLYELYRFVKILLSDPSNSLKPSSSTSSSLSTVCVTSSSSSSSFSSSYSSTTRTTSTTDSITPIKGETSNKENNEEEEEEEEEDSQNQLFLANIRGNIYEDAESNRKLCVTFIDEMEKMYKAIEEREKEENETVNIENIRPANIMTIVNNIDEDAIDFINIYINNC